MPAKPALRIGHGFDSHRLEPRSAESPASPLVIGGVEIPGDIGVIAHSDGDVLFHAITDALLGAIAEPDIGSLFPDTDDANRAADSIVFLEEAVHRVRRAGYELINIDTTVILQRPKLADHTPAIRASIATACGIPTECANIKCKTAERLDAAGEGRAIIAHAVCLMRAAD